MALTKVTYSMIADAVVNVMDFIPAGTNISAVDCQPYFAAAIAAGSSVYIPDGTYRTDTTIFVPNKKILFGESRDNSVIQYVGTGNGIEVGNNPVNGSGYGMSQLKNFKIRCVNVANTGAGIAMNSGGFSYYEVDLVWSTGFFYGIVIDQTEISHFHRCLFEGIDQENGAPMWITNGADWRAGGFVRFTNGLTIQDCQFNGGKYNIIDDGGNVHVFIENNLNGAKLGGAYFAGVTGLTFTGQAYETSYGVGEVNLFFSVVSGVSGTLKGPCRGATISGNTFSAQNNTSNAMIAFPVGNLPLYHSGFSITGNYFVPVLGGAPAAIDVTALSQSFCGFNFDFGPAGDPRPHYAGIHNDANGNVLYPPTGENNSDSTLPYSFGDTQNEVRFAGGFGYDTGTGGTVTQATNKSTAVTLNKMCGKITTNNAPLGANTTVTFALNNTQIGVNDSILVNVNSPGLATDGTYQAWANVGLSNQTVICLRNISGGSLSEAVVLTFNVIKGVVA
jgi:hypothetical protein